MDASHLETRLLSQLQDPAQEMDTDGESQVDSPQDSPCAETPLAPSPTPPQLHTPDRSCPGTSFLPHLDLSRVETPLLSSPLNLSQTDTRFVSIQDISEMETPFLPVPPLPESPTEAPLLPPLPLLTGHPAVPVGLDCSDNGIHSCMSSASCLASAMSTPLAIKKFKASDSDTGTDLLPVCRICQLPGDKEDFLFSPCRCSGTMMFVHYLCLLVSCSSEFLCPLFMSVTYVPLCFNPIVPALFFFLSFVICVHDTINMLLASCIPWIDKQV